MNDDVDETLLSMHAGSQPPPDLEDRVVGELKRRGLLRDDSRSPRRAWLAAAAAAAAVLLFFSGTLVGSRVRRAASSAGGERFVIFLYEGSDFQAPSPGTESERVGEYRAWARQVGESGRSIEGEKLKDRELTFDVRGHTEESSGTIGGYFIIGAKDYEDARSAVSTCPHLRHGGRIVIRQIDHV